LKIANRKAHLICLKFVIWVSAISFGCTRELPARFNVDKAEGNIPSPGREIRILTLNVWSGLTYKGFLKMGQYQDDTEQRYRVLIKAISRIEPDVMAIQEANPLPFYAKRLARDLNYQVIYRITLGGIRFGSLGIPTNLREGGAILVKGLWSIFDHGRKRLSGSGIATNWFCFHFGEITQAILGQAEMNGKSLYIYSVHLHSGPFRGSAFNKAVNAMARETTWEKVEEAKRYAEKAMQRRRHEIAALKAFVEATLPPGVPALLLGDFNTTVESGELDPLLSGGNWVDSYRFKNPDDEGVTWDPFGNPNFRQTETSTEAFDRLRAYHERYPSRIDFIFSRNLPRDSILESRVVLTPENGVCASDHYGVLTTLKW